MLIAYGQCVEQYGACEAYLPLLEATARLCRGPDREQCLAALKQYAPSWLLQLPGLLTLEDRALLQPRVQETNRERMLREMAEAAEQFTSQRTLIIVLEDLHWSDMATLDWLTYIARRREPARLLILGTYRPGDVLASNHPLRAVVQELQIELEEARTFHDVGRIEKLRDELEFVTQELVGAVGLRGRVCKALHLRNVHA